MEIENDKIDEINNIKENILLKDLYFDILQKMLKIYEKVFEILIIPSSDIFFDFNLSILKSNKILNDNEKFNELFEEYKNLNALMFRKNENKKEINYKILNKNENHSKSLSGHILKDVSKEKKKKYEVQKFIEFIKASLEFSNDEEYSDFDFDFIEIGCGKSYLAKSLVFNFKKANYIGIDREFLDKSLAKKDKRITLIKSEINSKTIDGLISDVHKISDRKKIIVSLHSCGNLTNYGLVMFANKKIKIDSIFLVGCCNHLLKERILCCNSSRFNNYTNQMGINFKTNKYLDDSFVVENELEFNDDLNVLFPISKSLKKFLMEKELFFGKSIKKISNQDMSDEILQSQHHKFFKKAFIRTSFYLFLYDNIPILYKYFGIGEIDTDGDQNMLDEFKEYFYKSIKKVIIMIDDMKILENEKLEIKSKIHKLFFENEEQTQIILCDFYDKTSNYYEIMIKYYLIRFKLGKVVEDIINLDRVVFLQENGFYKSQLIKIFDEKFSKRNTLIYSKM